MIREPLLTRGAGLKRHFRLRGVEISRLEGFSDAVFAFSMTLLVVSLEAPRTFHELLGSVRALPAFGVCFFLLMDIWFEHYTFFRRYGIEDGFVKGMNTALLFVVLFFVYPLKFLFSLLLGQIFNAEALEHSVPAGQTIITREDWPTLMVIYAIGAIAVFTIFTLLHWHAYKRREDLELNELEVFDTRSSINHNIVMLAVPLVSLLIAVFGRPEYIAFSGWAYFLYGPAITIERSWEARVRRKLEAKLEASG